MSASFFEDSIYNSFRKRGLDLLFMELALWYQMNGVPDAVKNESFKDWLKNQQNFVDMHVYNSQGKRIRLSWTPENVLAVILTSQLEWWKKYDRSNKGKYQETSVLEREFFERTAANSLILQKSVSLLRSTGTAFNWNTPMTEVFDIFVKYMEYMDSALFVDRKGDILHHLYQKDLKKVESEEAAMISTIKQLTTKLQQCEESKSQKRVASASARDVSRPKRNAAKINYKKLRRYEE